jgi:hypothetical protein
MRKKPSHSSPESVLLMSHIHWVEASEKSVNAAPASIVLNRVRQKTGMQFQDGALFDFYGADEELFELEEPYIRDFLLEE